MIRKQWLNKKLQLAKKKNVTKNVYWCMSVHNCSKKNRVLKYPEFWDSVIELKLAKINVQLMLLWNKDDIKWMGCYSSFKKMAKKVIFYNQIILMKFCLKRCQSIMAYINIISLLQLSWQVHTLSDLTAFNKIK